MSFPQSHSKKSSTPPLQGYVVYKKMEGFILSHSDQVSNCFPRPDPTEKGRAIVSWVNKLNTKANVKLLPGQRLCDFCESIYNIDEKGMAVNKDEKCIYHFGQSFQRRGFKTPYSCCNNTPDSKGCSVSKWHVSYTGNPDVNSRGYVSTLAKASPVLDHNNIFALDCEMCYTTEGREAIKVTVVSSELKTVYETLVLPDNPILDLNTRFSGITEEEMRDVKTTIRDVQGVLLNLFSDKTILIGHGLDGDLRALKMLHDKVVDTSVVFPHAKGPPFKKALRTICLEFLGKTIQKEAHKSAEDAGACMELMLWKIQNPLK